MRSWMLVVQTTSWFRFCTIEKTGNSSAARIAMIEIAVSSDMTFTPVRVAGKPVQPMVLAPRDHRRIRRLFVDQLPRIIQYAGGAHGPLRVVVQHPRGGGGIGPGAVLEIVAVSRPVEDRAAEAVRV